VIIIDEFNASGETRVGLMRLLQLFEKRVLSYLSIVDWNPKQSGVSGAICYSLYDFQGYEVSV
jgi:adenine/guanine phosphoribosyltransferase-like PRPP-binding protein